MPIPRTFLLSMNHIFPRVGVKRLWRINRLCCILVKADIEDVLSFVRAEATAREMTLHELHGEEAQVERAFGPQTSFLTQFPDQEFIRETFSLRGWRRVSRLLANPKYVMFEEHLDQVTDVNLRHLQFWTGGETYLIRSQTAPYGLNKEHAIALGVVDAIGEHGFTAATCDSMRSLSYISWTGTKKELHTFGEPWEIEDSYEGVAPSQVITRNRICYYLDRLGINPEATFDRRELGDAVLFTEDHHGTPMTPDPSGAERFLEMTEGVGWFPKVQLGIWF